MSEERAERLSAHEVAAWLRRHPKFLSQFPDLTLSLVVPREDGPAASLASYQLEVLRDKNRELNRRLAELFANAQENERLTVRTHQLALSLMRAGSAADTVLAMVASLGEDFQGDAVRIVLFDEQPGLAAPWLQVIPVRDKRMAPFKDCVTSGEPLCGRLNPDKMELLFGDDQSQAQSVALIPVTNVGLVAVGSRDGNRFFPGMGTLFLRLMGESFAAALARFPKH
ncbi:DUF484 family protein [Arenimonas sp.]|uniref:DUF484 family protein n=1 Tax=Arenimonas sp. TaxID=1872635 RepID=UPI0039E6AE83